MVKILESFSIIFTPFLGIANLVKELSETLIISMGYDNKLDRIISIFLQSIIFLRQIFNPVTLLIMILITQILSLYGMFLISKYNRVDRKYLFYIPIFGIIYFIVMSNNNDFSIFYIHVFDKLKIILISCILLVIYIIMYFLPVYYSPEHYSPMQLYFSVMYVMVLIFSLKFEFRLINRFIKIFYTSCTSFISLICLLAPVLFIIFVYTADKKKNAECFTSYGNYERGSYANTGLKSSELNFDYQGLAEEEKDRLCNKSVNEQSDKEI